MLHFNIPNDEDVAENCNSKVDSSMLQFNIHNDQGAAKSYNFEVDAKYPAVSFPIFVLQFNIPNNKDKIYLVFWLLILLSGYL